MHRLAILIVALGCAGLSASLAPAEVAQKNGVRVSVDGSFAPTHLPRKGELPVAVSLAGRISSRNADEPPQLQTLTVAINRNGHISSRGLPVCRIGKISPSTTEEALAACRAALVGEGSFSARVELPEQSPFPSQGRVLAFNGRLNGRPVIFAHIYGTKPIPTSYVLPLVITRGHGELRTILTASLPRVTGKWGFVTGISLTLNRRFSFRGKQQGFISAACPAPSGFSAASFTLMKISFGFAGGFTVGNTLIRSCRVNA